MTTSTDIQDLFASAKQDLSTAGAEVLVNNLNATTIAGAQGASVDKLVGDEVTLFVQVLDMTGSMYPYQNELMAAYNEQIEALLQSKNSDNILMSALVFNTKSTVLHGYVSLADAQRLDSSVYNPDHQTALFDAVLDAFTGVVLYSQSLRDAGVRTKIVVVVITDGEDNSSRKKASDVAIVAKDLLQQEIYTLALVAFGLQGKPIAQAMGFPAANVLDATADKHGWRVALGQVSKSVIRKSQANVGDQSTSFFN